MQQGVMIQVWQPCFVPANIAIPVLGVAIFADTTCMSHIYP